MSSGEGRVATWSALPRQPVAGIEKDLRAMTSAKRLASGSDSSSDTSECKAKGVDPMDDNDSSDDGFLPAPARDKQKKKKKKMKPQSSTEDFRKTAPPGAFESKIPVKARKAEVKRGTQTAPGPRRKAEERRYMPSAPTTAAVRSSPGASIATPIPNVPSATQPRIGRSAEDRLFIEFLGIPLTSVNAVKVRAEVNKLFGPLSADVPAPSSTYVRVQLGGPEKGPNKTRLLGLTEICEYKIKVTEPREVTRHRGRYVQKVIKGVPLSLSDEDISISVKEQGMLNILKVAR